ncbi:MAG: hypothetical protein NUV77_19500, partial [Thermoguttaceae bacterium]|nr:hypothetical protein [Thermoguttaceae bacterium]
MFRLHHVAQCAVLAVSFLWTAEALAESPPGDMVRADWYFRESLPAIRGWETVLEQWEKANPPRPVAPLLPVPANGEAVEWPNPIPLLLLPPEDRAERVSVRLVDGRIEVERFGTPGATKREVFKPGETIQGYKHPGGGGKDQWYHAYHRRFDRLTAFVPKPAPLAVHIAAPLDLRRGSNELSLTLRNVSGGPLALGVRLEFHTPQAVRECGRQAVSLAAGTSQTVRFAVQLETEGGGLLVVAIDGAGEAFWMPLLTHVEDLSAVVRSVEQMLADVPDAAAANRLASLLRRCASAGADWRSLFEEASRLRDELLLSRIPVGAILFVKRKPYFSEQPFMDAHHLFNRPGGGIYRLSPVRPDGKVTPVVDSLGEGVYRDLCLDWDARHFLFAFGNGSDRWDGGPSYHLFEAGIDGSGLRQITTGPKNDCEPFYLADGQIGFTSDRSEHFVMCGGNRHSPTLFVVNRDGSNVRQLSFNVFNDFNPTMLPDGRILYSRWEYNERSVTSLHNPFTMNPDGTMVQPYYGNATIRPNVVMFPRPVPGSTKVMALFTAHHGQTHGPVGLIDVRRGIDGDGPLEILTPNVPVTGEKAEDSRYGWFSDPWPLAEDLFL